MKLLENKSTLIKLLSITLILINVLLISKFELLKSTLANVFSAIFLPIFISIILYYLLRPIIRYFVRLGLDKLSSIIVIYLVIIGLLVITSVNLFPVIKSQLIELSIKLPEISKSLLTQTERLVESTRFVSKDDLHSLVQSIDINKESIIALINDLSKSIIHLTMSLVMSPFIVFYLFKDEDDISNRFIKIFPQRFHDKLVKIIKEVDLKLSSYIQSQIVISIIVGLMFAILFNIIGLPYATLLGILGGLFNMIPYFGSMFIVAIILMFSITISPLMFIKTAICCVIEQTVEGRLVTPLILSKELEIHPITIMIVLLSANSIFGILGVFLAIPVYSIVKLIVVASFKEFKKRSDLYE